MRKFYHSLPALLVAAGMAFSSNVSLAADSYDVVGTYDMKIQPTSIWAEKTQETVDVTVEVRKSGDNYSIAEIDGTDYLKGYEAPFTYNAASKMANFVPVYQGQTSDAAFADCPYIWFSAFSGGFMAEPQPQYGVTFEPASGFTFPEDGGLAWYGSDSDSSFNPYDVINAFYVISCTVSSNPGGGEEIFGDASIEGEWNFTLNGHYLGDYSIGEFTETFTATLGGNVVTFESSGSQYNIVAVFTAENTLTFNKTLVGSNTSAYGLWQSPYVNSTGINDLEDLGEEVFTATYDPEKGVITFPANSGLRYGYFNNQNGQLSYWDDAFDLVSASQASNDPVGGNYGDATIQGLWDFTLNGHYLGEYSIGRFTESFNATLDGNVVTFESSGSQYNIVAEFVAENTLKFTQRQVGPDATYVLWQSPYVNSDNVENLEDLTSDSFTATYDPEAGTIVFPANSGLRYGYFSQSGALSYWDDAFDFVTAGRSGNEAPDLANEEIEGEWEFTLNGRYLGDESLGIFTETMVATLDGNTVTFASSGSAYNIVAEFTAENTLTFRQVAVGDPAAYTLYQSPYVNTNNATVLSDLQLQEFKATFNPEAGTITFPENSGLRYGSFDTSGSVYEWYDAFDFVTAVRKANEVEGVYVWIIQPTDVTGVRSAQPVEINVEVKNIDGNNYTISELGSTNYFNDQVIPFTYSPETGYAQFKAGYAGMLGNQPTWLAAFVYNDAVSGSFIEAQDELGVPFSVEDGFQFNGFTGFAWFVTTSEEEFNAQSVYSAFYVTDKTSAVQNVEIAPVEGETIYFDLQGRRVNNPQGGIFIKVTGNKAQKVIINK